MEIIFFCLTAFGITNALSFLHVGHWFRRLVCGLWDKGFYHCLRNDHLGDYLEGFRQRVLGRLVHCHACLGFWVGFGLSAGGLGPFWAGDLWWLAAIMDGFFVSSVNFILWVTLRKLGADKL